MTVLRGHRTRGLEDPWETVTVRAPGDPDPRDRPDKRGTGRQGESAKCRGHHPGDTATRNPAVRAIPRIARDRAGPRPRLHIRTDHDGPTTGQHTGRPDDPRRTGHRQTGARCDEARPARTGRRRRQAHTHRSWREERGERGPQGFSKGFPIPSADPDTAGPPPRVFQFPVRTRPGTTPRRRRGPRPGPTTRRPVNAPPRDRPAPPAPAHR